MKKEKEQSKIYFSDFFDVSHEQIESYGALDISLVADNQAFVDPFLIFANEKYKKEHDFIINYLKFLKTKSLSLGTLTKSDFQQFYKFSEVKEVWLGYSVSGNTGSGLSIIFANSLFSNLNTIFAGKQKGITKSEHLEKVCLIENGVGVDKISDFTLNLIKKFLLEYTEKFSKKYIDAKYLDIFAIRRVSFDFKKENWVDGKYKLPFILDEYGQKQYVLLVPKDILAKEDTWISKNDFLKNDSSIFATIENSELRDKMHKYFIDALDTKFTKDGKIEKDFSNKSKKEALIKTAYKYPEILDFYIRYKEAEKSKALENNIKDVEDIDLYFDVQKIKSNLVEGTFSEGLSVIDDVIDRILFFKKVVENNPTSIIVDGKKFKEKQLQLMFKLATFGTIFNYDSEVNNGRGPIDFIISYGKEQKIGLEFKMASNTRLKENLLNQGKAYQESSDLNFVMKVIFYYSDQELEKVERILRQINKAEDNKEIFLVDLRPKPSASNVK